MYSKKIEYMSDEYMNYEYMNHTAFIEDYEKALPFTFLHPLQKLA